jgi:hypothetical protein
MLASTRALGQHLFHPPSVKGWDANEAWITTSSLMLRGNLAGVLLDVVAIEDVVPGEAGAVAMDELEADEEFYAESGAEMRMEGEPPARNLGELAPLARLSGLRWRPRASLAARMAAAGATRDGAMADALAADLLAIPPDAATREAVASELRARRESAGLANGDLLSDRETAEHVLRDVAHVLLSLPEAQLH